MKSQISARNLNMIKTIMNNNFDIYTYHIWGYDKYVNNTFDIIYQNNKSIIVIDKIKKRFYKDLRIAMTTI